ncbi:MAG: hypothetical protein VKM92_04100 [Cyanobacteriota bacterium]|nr:hypothetical protein [Cyanobacteriota bacterium]
MDVAALASTAAAAAAGAGAAETAAGAGAAGVAAPSPEQLQPQLPEPLELLQPLAESLDPAWITAALARRRDVLERIRDEQVASGRWGAASALQLAHLWLVAGLPGRGDDLVLEAHQLAPQAALIPDWWGLWPQPAEQSAQQLAQAAPLRQLAAGYVQLRHLPPLDAWRAWLRQVQAERRCIDEPALRLLLGLVVHGRRALPGPLEPALEQLVGEELVAAEPALAWRFFDPLCERLPEWGYGRLKAADLSLQRGELQRCRQHLQAATDAQWQLAWLHDIAARLALAEGTVQPALAAWARAIERTQAPAQPGESAAGPQTREQLEQQAQVVEIFRQRAREARRGPGVLQARSLLNRGQQSEAIALLELLLQHDPQWQPLRSLLEQARQSRATTSAGSPTSSATTTSPTTSPTASPATTADLTDLARLEQRLRLLAERAQLAWPPPSLPPERDAAAAEQVLQQALARLALLG